MPRAAVGRTILPTCRFHSVRVLVFGAEGEPRKSVSLADLAKVQPSAFLDESQASFQYARDLCDFELHVAGWFFYTHQGPVIRDLLAMGKTTQRGTPLLIKRAFL